MVMTLVFPDSLSNTSPRTAPSAMDVAIPPNSSVKILPPTWNPLSLISQDTTLAFAVSADEASDFLDSIQELPNKKALPEENAGVNDGASAESNKWAVKAARNGGNPAQATMRLSATNTWTGFVDLIKVSWRLLGTHHSVFANAT